MIFDRRKRVEKYEEEFETESLKNKPVFYDLDLSDIKNVEELRSFLLGNCRGRGYSASLNELTKFQSEEFEGIFKGGSMKPIRGLLKATKKIKRGLRHPYITSLFFIASILLLVLSFKPGIINVSLKGKENLLALLAIFSALTSLLTFMIKERSLLKTWIKIVGIQDPTKETADVRVVLAGEVEGEGKETLREDLSSIYESLTSVFVGGKELPEPKEEEPILKKGEKGAKEKVIDKISQSVDSLDQLDERLARGEISEEKYDEMKERLEMKKRKYETLLDIVK